MADLVSMFGLEYTMAGHGWSLIRLAVALDALHTASLLLPALISAALRALCGALLRRAARSCSSLAAATFAPGLAAPLGRGRGGNGLAALEWPPGLPFGTAGDLRPSSSLAFGEAFLTGMLGGDDFCA
ncbi:hypothetical protein ACTMU2_30505 [Cupriavidus basilensis]